jgi:hypothetical protein
MLSPTPNQSNTDNVAALEAHMYWKSVLDVPEPLLRSLPIKSIDEMLKLSDVKKNLIYTASFRRLRNGLNENPQVKQISIFALEDGTPVNVMADQYKDKMHELMKFFIKVENYEVAAECRDAILLYNQSE